MGTVHFEFAQHSAHSTNVRFGQSWVGFDQSGSANFAVGSARLSVHTAVLGLCSTTLWGVLDQLSGFCRICVSIEFGLRSSKFGLGSTPGRD